MDKKKWVVVKHAFSETEALIVKGLLESCGIPASVKQEAIGKIHRLTVDGLGEIKVEVPQEFAEQAVKILSSENNGKKGG